MAKAETTNAGFDCLNIEFMRYLVKQYSELGQWSSALFWADAAAAVGTGNGAASGDDIWLLANVMLSRGELHRAAHAITSRGLHRQHLLCLGVAMRAYLAAREPTTVITLIEECEPNLLETRSADDTHNRALASVLISQARALWALERREAGTAALCSALRADCSCFEALELLLEHHALTPAQEKELVESLSLSSQMGAAEAEFVLLSYRERLNRYAPATHLPPVAEVEYPISVVECCRSRTLEAAVSRARRLVGACEWRTALRMLDAAGPWAGAEIRTACLVELRRATDLFMFGHVLVDAYPHSWTAWYAVGCYYYLIGKSEFARRFLSKAKSMEPGAGCVWLAYGHSFAHDNEHDQAMAAYFKASQLMGGCHLPPLYVGVECSQLNNSAMCERFMARAAAMHANVETGADKSPERESEGGWMRLVGTVQEPHVAHEAGVAAFNAGDHIAAYELFTRALDIARGDRDISQLSSRWGATLDALGHAARRLGHVVEACGWHARALVARPQRAHSLAARALALALRGPAAAPAAAQALHAALAIDPDHVCALQLLDALVDCAPSYCTDEEIPQFPFPAVHIAPSVAAPAPASAPIDCTNTSDMSMSFD